MEQEQVQETTQEMTDPNTTNMVAIAMKKTAELNAHIEYLPALLMAAYNEIVRIEGELKQLIEANANKGEGK
jgi:hypothetical protein